MNYYFTGYFDMRHKFEKFETNSFGTEMDNAGGLGHSMFGNSEISDTQIINRGASLHERGESVNLAAAQSTEFFTLNDPSNRNQTTTEPFGAPDNAFEDSDGSQGSDDFKPTKKIEGNDEKRTES